MTEDLEPKSTQTMEDPTPPQPEPEPEAPAPHKTEGGMNLVRLGHYFTPQSGVDSEEVIGQCETALVCAVNDSADGELVTIAVWGVTAVMDSRQMIHVGEPKAGEYSFHLALDCPWKR